MEFGGVVPGVGAEEAGGAAVGAEHAEQDADGGGLSRPVRAEEAVGLAFVDAQVELVERGHVTEALDEFLGSDDSGHEHEVITVFINL